MKTLKQALLISLMAIVVGVSVNFVRSDGLPVFFSEYTNTADGEDTGQAEQISIEQGRAILKIGQSLFLDLQSADAFSKVHIPGAINFPAEEIYGQLANIELQIPKDTEIVLYGVDKEDSAPMEVASLIEMLGYRNIKIMAEGWAGWEEKKI
ncbi:MAG: rhodanese-like domain-containing protein [Proteobacteria bacterium]|nr:rhodanese-like domain-containing protein [Pseudomonadota bacterium]MBU4260003.1 rhodanese-like domain-containing protein [Pseudomonadota bacterium]MBU4287842.1 rhodanese-like domain-containing protein [Pseudomonadota bacterium]MCG2829982.1 rhodanese-like domain-containing protein [Desulfobacteraceae bacterium]